MTKKLLIVTHENLILGKYIVKDLSRYALSCVYFGKDGTVVTCGQKLLQVAYGKSPWKKGEEPVHFPKPFDWKPFLLSQDDNAQMFKNCGRSDFLVLEQYKDNVVTFRHYRHAGKLSHQYKAGTVFTFRTAEGLFPEYEAIIPEEVTVPYILSKKILKEIIDATPGEFLYLFQSADAKGLPMYGKALQIVSQNRDGPEVPKNVAVLMPSFKPKRDNLPEFDGKVIGHVED